MDNYEDDYIDELLVNVNEKTREFAKSMWKRRDEFQKMWLITSQDSGLQYLVGKKRDGSWECSCLGYQMYGKYHRLKKYRDVDPTGSKCKHILYVERNENVLQPFYDSRMRDSGIVIMNAFNNYFYEDELPKERVEGDELSVALDEVDDFPEFLQGSGNFDMDVSIEDDELNVTGESVDIDVKPQDVPEETTLTERMEREEEIEKEEEEKEDEEWEI